MNEKISINDELAGCTTVAKVLGAHVKIVKELESLTGRGYTLTQPVVNGEIVLTSPDPSELSDREKISAAFMELETVHNYAAPVSLAWEADCIHHAMEAIGERYSEDVPGIAFWFTDLDDDAFGYRGYSSFIKKAYDDLENDVDKLEWAESNVEMILSAEISERIQHNTLIRPLWIYWGGDSDLIIKVLEKHGLEIGPRRDENEVIYVLPSSSEPSV